MSSLLPCACPSPSVCRCPISQWREPIQFSNHYQGPYGQLHPDGSRTSSNVPPPKQQWPGAPQPQQKYYYAPQPSFPFLSTPLPLPSVPQAIITSPADNATAPPSQPTRKRKNAISSGSTAPVKKRRKPRISVTVSLT